MLVIMKRIGWFSLSLVIVVSAGCGSDSSTSISVKGSESHTAVMQVVNNTIIPRVENFATQVASLDNQAETFCITINEANLAATQNQWKVVAQAWYEILPFKFGPMEGGLDINILEPVYSYVDYYRFNKGNDVTLTVRNQVESWVNSSTPTTITDTYFSLKAASLVGLLPLEVTLFETMDTQSKVAADLVAEFNAKPRKCQVLTGLTYQLQLHANEILDGWKTDYAQTGISYRQLLQDDQLSELVENEEGDSSISKLTVSIQDYFDYLKNRNITTETGQISASIWQSVEPSLYVIKEVLAGTADTSLSLNAIMVNNGFEQTIASVVDNVETLRTAINETNTINFQAAAGILDGNFKRDVPDALGVSLGLNFSDGD